MLAIQVVVDAATFGPFLDDIDRPGLHVDRHVGAAPVTADGHMSKKALWGEFGLSLLASSKMGDETRRILIDFGYTPEALANNVALLGIDPDQIDATVLSHGHLDHYGGFPGLFANAPARARHIPFVVGGEEAFCNRIAMTAKPPLIMGALDRTALAQAGFAVEIRPEPSVVAGQAFTTGIIPLQTTERAAIPTAMRPGEGCKVTDLSEAKRLAEQAADDGEHELATCYNVKGLGLVVIVSCGHRGVLNSIRRAQAISGVQKIHAVVGGFHLVKPRTEAEAKATAAAMVEIAPDYIIPMHCTGEVFITEATRLMPDKVIRPFVGNRLIFAA
ncbi:hypothetical protein ABENE_22470 [Asticcacaulis benevestitus DSM 16100 = ATCC BAA-896]|uniref:Metallo-beta-lactamase domain-containing protein n=2 Tax=Asticcacaulis TaxID=76890 RepID=V4QM74_9CAUL|nr:hypothetical protein ABENE_22470 [Asticcacaulis benevestitus DSM 16100 = ATCC BAA-896]